MVVCDEQTGISTVVYTFGVHYQNGQNISINFQEQYFYKINIFNLNK